MTKMFSYKAFSLFMNKRKINKAHYDMSGDMLAKCPHCEKRMLFKLKGWYRKTKNGHPYIYGTIAQAGMEEYASKMKILEHKEKYTKNGGIDFEPEF